MITLNKNLSHLSLISLFVIFNEKLHYIHLMLALFHHTIASTPYIVRNKWYN